MLTAKLDTPETTRTCNAHATFEIKADWKYFHPDLKIASFERQLPFVISAVDMSSILRHRVPNSSANLSATN